MNALNYSNEYIIETDFLIERGSESINLDVTATLDIGDSKYYWPGNAKVEKYYFSIENKTWNGQLSESEYLELDKIVLEKYDLIVQNYEPDVD